MKVLKFNGILFAGLFVVGCAGAYRPTSHEHDFGHRNRIVSREYIDGVDERSLTIRYEQGQEVKIFDLDRNGFVDNWVIGIDANKLDDIDFALYFTQHQAQLLLDEARNP